MHEIREVLVLLNGWINKDELVLWMQQHIDCFILLKSYNSKYLWLRSQCSDCYTLAKVIKMMTVQQVNIIVEEWYTKSLECTCEWCRSSCWLLYKHHFRISLEMVNFYRYFRPAMWDMYFNKHIPDAVTFKQLSCVAQELQLRMVGCIQSNHMTVFLSQ